MIGPHTHKHTQTNTYVYTIYNIPALGSCVQRTVFCVHTIYNILNAVCHYQIYMHMYYIYYTKYILSITYRPSAAVSNALVASSRNTLSVGVGVGERDGER